MSELSHIDEHGHAVMVDVTAKPATHRRAEARCRVAHSGELGARATELFAQARAAGLLGAKQTAALIPLCHPLPLVAMDIQLVAVDDAVEISAVVETYGQTGVEMEALTACSITALALIASIGEATPDIGIEDLLVWEKLGGRSGHWSRAGNSGPIDEEAVRTQL